MLLITAIKHFNSHSVIPCVSVPLPLTLTHPPHTTHTHTHTHALRVDDDSGDRTNAKIVERLMPDKDYYLQIQTFKPEGGKFEFSITSW